MKKLLAVLMSVCLLAGLAGCAKDVTESNSTTLAATSSEAATTTAATTSGPAETSASEQPVSQTTNSTDASSSGSIRIADKSLKGEALLQSVEWEMPESFYYAAVMTMANDQSADMECWIDGENMRMESESPEIGGVNVMIYNANEKMTYQFIKGETEGIAMPDGEDYDDEDEELAIAGFSEIVADSESYENLQADIRELDGEEVIYLEYSYTEDSVTGSSQMWYSLETGFLVKAESYLGNELISKQVVTSFDSKLNIEKSVFEAPSDVEFTDFSMDDVFDQFEGLLDGLDLDDLD